MVLASEALGWIAEVLSSVFQRIGLVLLERLEQFHALPMRILAWLDDFGVQHEHALTSLGTIAVALFTLGLWLSTVALWRATKAQLKLARQEFVASHRPHVIVRFIQIPFQDDAGLWNAWVTVANTGDTPATITHFGGDLPRKILGGWAPPGINATAVPIKPIKIASGQRHTFTVSGQMSDKEYQEKFGGAGQIWCVGELNYFDDNGIRRATSFNRYWDQGQGLILPSPLGEEYAD